jgi:hypothetical protein
VQVISERFNVRRLPTWCMTCEMEIAKGTRYRRSTIKYEGRVYSWIEHVECQEIGQACLREWPHEEVYTADMVHEFMNDADENALQPLSNEARERILMFRASTNSHT